MAGRKPIKIYQYAYDDTGKFLKEYDNISQVRNKYFANVIGKYPMFQHKNKDYMILEDNTIISPRKIGREGIRIIMKREKNPYLNLGYKARTIEVYNLDNVKIAEFASNKMVEKLCNIDPSTLHAKLNQGSNHDHNGLLFKYKEQ